MRMIRTFIIRTFTLTLLTAAAILAAPAAASALNFESAPGSPLGGVGGLANDVATGDFDEDGTDDLAIASTDYPGDDKGIFVELSNGSGGFTPAAGSPLLPTRGFDSYVYGARAVEAVDLNYDTHLDLVILAGGNGSVVTFFGDGDGNFTQHADFSTSKGAAGDEVAIGDVNGDVALGLEPCLQHPEHPSDCANPDPDAGAVFIAEGDGTGAMSAAAGNPHAPVGTSRLVVMLAAPSVAADPQDFGSLRTGKTSAPRTVTVTNDGPLPAEITSVVWGCGDFLELTSNNLDDCSGTLLPGESCSVVVAFSPSSSGRLTSSLSLYLSGVTAPREIELTGYSEEKPVKLGFKAAAAKKVKRGKTLAIKVKVRNTFPYKIPAPVTKAKVPAKLAKKPKTVKIPALKPGKSVSRTIKAKVKRNAKKGARLKFTVDVRYKNRLAARTRGSSKIK
jgi:hypothetical protein